MDTVYAGASITGQSHEETGQENQDSFCITRYGFGMVMVVADGLGTKKHSKIGSKEVCKAVGEATKVWIKKQNTPTEYLIKLIHNVWDLYIYPYKKNDCATTCLFSIVLNNGRVILGQLGDGIIYYNNGENLNVLTEIEDEFLNITKSMSSAKSICEWKFKEISLTDQDFTLLMTTDGLSEDIIKEKRQDFMNYILKQIESKKRQSKKNLVIKKILKSTNSKYSYDDKTLIIFNRKGKTGE